MWKEQVQAETLSSVNCVMSQNLKKFYTKDNTPENKKEPSKAFSQRGSPGQSFHVWVPTLSECVHWMRMNSLACLPAYLPPF